MKKYKLDIVTEMEKRANEMHSISVCEAARAVGINRLKISEVFEIINLFVHRHPEYIVYQLVDERFASAYETVFVSDNETPPIK